MLTVSPTTTHLLTRHPVLSRLGMPAFRPLPPFLDGMSQTLATSALPEWRDIPSTATELVDVAGGDQVVLLENRSPAWRPGDRIVLLVHGLAGCHQSKYMIRMTRKLSTRGYLAVRMNLRGCGPGVGYARKPYHSGLSEDLRCALQRLHERYPDSPVTLAGFSLSANTALKLAGEEGASPTPGLTNFDSLVAISPPVNLAASAQKLRKPEARVFRSFFLRKLFKHVAQTRQHYPDLPELKPWKGMDLTDFDEIYTAPMSGYKNAAHYYESAAALPLLGSIRVPTLILASADDPVIDASSLLSMPSLSNVDSVITEKGGHVAFLGRDIAETGIRWMDTLISRWVDTLPER